MLTISDVLKSNHKLIRRLINVKKELEEEREKVKLFKEQIKGRDDWGRNACVLIRQQLECIQSAENTHLGAETVQAQKDIVLGFLSDRITMLVKDDVYQWPNLHKLSDKQILALATDIIERTNPTAPIPPMFED